MGGVMDAGMLSILIDLFEVNDVEALLLDLIVVRDHQQQRERD